MDAYLSNNRNRAINFERPPVLIAADNDRAIVRARATVASAGFRISDAVGIEIASDRLDRQAAASALWLEFDASLSKTPRTRSSIVRRQASAKADSGPWSRFPAT